MPELSDLLNDAIGDVPAFDARAMVARQRHRRQMQAAAVVSVVVVTGSAFAVWANASDNDVVVATRSSSTDDSSTTLPMTSTGVTVTDPSPDTTVTGIAPSTTVPPDYEPTTTVPSGAAVPQASDFTGTLTVSATTVTVGEAIDIELRIRNVSGHAVDTLHDSRPDDVMLFCPNVNPDGSAMVGPLEGNNAWFLTQPTMQPGADNTVSVHFQPSADGVGTVKCQGAIVTEPPYNNWRWPTNKARITSIPTVTFTVLEGEATTTVPSTSAPTTTPAP